jgi:hypothetical protein
VKAVLYLRVSTTEQSYENQVPELEAMAKAKARHLTDAGILSNWSKATGQTFTDLGSRILENPTATFDHTLKGGQAVKGFLGQVEGQNNEHFAGDHGVEAAT